MHVERQLAQLPHCLDHFRAEREVRNELPVHDVDMKPVGASGLAHGDVVGELREIRAQQRRRDADALHLAVTRARPRAHRRVPTLRFTFDPDAA